MSTKAEVSFKQHSMVWVWDSTWLPAIVVYRASNGCVLVRLTHGVTFSAPVANLLPRDPACRGSDVPSAGSFRSSAAHAQGPRVLRPKGATMNADTQATYLSPLLAGRVMP
jgi:hypothetical protein